MKLLKVTSFAKITVKHLFCNTEITILVHVKRSGTVILLTDNSDIKSSGQALESWVDYGGAQLSSVTV